MRLEIICLFDIHWWCYEEFGSFGILSVSFTPRFGLVLFSQFVCFRFLVFLNIFLPFVFLGQIYWSTVNLIAWICLYNQERFLVDNNILSQNIDSPGGNWQFVSVLMGCQCWYRGLISFKLLGNLLDNLSRLMTKPTLVCVPIEDSDQSGHPPSLIRVFAVRMKKAWALSYPLSAQRRLIRLGRCPGWSESSLGAQSFC